MRRKMQGVFVAFWLGAVCEATRTHPLMPDPPMPFHGENKPSVSWNHDEDSRVNFVPTGGFPAGAKSG